MTPLVFWLALALGVDAGYEPAADGQLEYIIQIGPQQVATLGAGRDVASEVPSNLDIRHYRITVGNGVLPRNAAVAGESFEAPARIDAAENSATSHVREGYLALSNGGGQFAIEIDPSAVDELNQHDLTGDIPAGLTITRFLVSTREGTVAGDRPQQWGNTTAGATTAAMAPTADAVPTSGDEDPSTWTNAPPAGVPTLAAPPARQSQPGASVPTVAAQNGFGQGGFGQGGAGQTGTGLPANDQEILDDIPEGGEPPPAAEPPPGFQSNISNGPIADNPPASQPLVDPPGGFNHQGRTHGAATGNPSMGGAPAPLPVGNSGQPMGTTGREGDPPQSGGHSRFRNDNEHGQGSEGEKKNAAPNHELKEKEADTPVLSLPLLVVICCLLPSIGLNIYLGWQIMEFYNRRSAQPSHERAAPRHSKSGHPHTRHSHERHRSHEDSDESRSAVSR